MAASSRSAARPRVALVAHGINDRGGMERAFAELVRGAHEDFDFTVIANDLAPELRPLVGRWDRVRVLPRPVPLKSIQFFVLAGWRIRRRSFDLVHTMGALVGNRADVASIQFCHAGCRRALGRLAPEEAPLLRRLNTAVARLLAIRCERWCYRPERLRMLAPVSEGVARELRRDYPGIATTITPNGVDTDRFKPDAAARTEVRNAEGVDDDSLVMLFVGGNWDRKGLDVAIQALGIVTRRGVRGTLWVVGAGDRRRYEGLAAREGVSERVRFFGSRSDTERFYQAADVFVLPTLYEAFPLVALEAGSSALPIVATPVSGIEELLAGGCGGTLVDRSPDSIASELRRLAIDPAARRRLGAEARERALSYTWSRSVASVTAVYRSLLSLPSQQAPVRLSA